MNILLLFGGKSCEHDISILTAKITLPVLKRIGRVYPVYVDKFNGWWYVQKELEPIKYKTDYKRAGKRVCVFSGENSLKVTGGLKRFVNLAKIDVAVPCFHGNNGEDGSVSGLLQLAGIPYTCGNPFACGASMDKSATKTVLRGMGANVLKGVTFNSPYDEKAFSLVKKLGFPLIVKPVSLGSSIGIKIADNVEELKNALDVAFCFDTRVLVEKALTDFYEINCAAFKADGRVVTSKIERPVSRDKILTFADKYIHGDKNGSDRVFPYSFDGEKSVRETTEKIYKTFNFDGVIRVDYLVDNVTGKIFVNEINSIPGSLAYYLFDEYGHEEFLTKLVQSAISAKKRRDKLVYAYHSNVLNVGKIKK